MPKTRPKGLDKWYLYLTDDFWPHVVATVRQSNAQCVEAVVAWRPGVEPPRFLATAYQFLYKLYGDAISWDKMKTWKLGADPARDPASGLVEATASCLHCISCDYCYKKSQVKPENWSAKQTKRRAHACSHAECAAGHFRGHGRHCECMELLNVDMSMREVVSVYENDKEVTRIVCTNCNLVVPFTQFEAESLFAHAVQQALWYLRLGISGDRMAPVARDLDLAVVVERNSLLASALPPKATSDLLARGAQGVMRAFGLAATASRAKPLPPTPSAADGTSSPASTSTSTSAAPPSLGTSPSWQSALGQDTMLEKQERLQEQLWSNESGDDVSASPTTLGNNTTTATSESAVDPQQRDGWAPQEDVAEAAAVESRLNTFSDDDVKDFLARTNVDLSGTATYTDVNDLVLFTHVRPTETAFVAPENKRQRRDSVDGDVHERESNLFSFGESGDMTYNHKRTQESIATLATLTVGLMFMVERLVNGKNEWQVTHLMPNDEFFYYCWLSEPDRWLTMSHIAKNMFPSLFKLSAQVGKLGKVTAFVLYFTDEFDNAHLLPSTSFKCGESHVLAAFGEFGMMVLSTRARIAEYNAKCDAEGRDWPHLCAIPCDWHMGGLCAFDSTEYNKYFPLTSAERIERNDERLQNAGIPSPASIEESIEKARKRVESLGFNVECAYGYLDLPQGGLVPSCRPPTAPLAPLSSEPTSDPTEAVSAHSDESDASTTDESEYTDESECTDESESTEVVSTVCDTDNATGGGDALPAATPANLTPMEPGSAPSTGASEPTSPPTQTTTSSQPAPSPGRALSTSSSTTERDFWHLLTVPPRDELLCENFRRICRDDKALGWKPLEECSIQDCDSCRLVWMMEMDDEEARLHAIVCKSTLMRRGCAANPFALALYCTLAMEGIFGSTKGHEKQILAGMTLASQLGCWFASFVLVFGDVSFWVQDNRFAWPAPDKQRTLGLLDLARHQCWWKDADVWLKDADVVKMYNDCDALVVEMSKDSPDGTTLKCRQCGKPRTDEEGGCDAYMRFKK